MYISPLSDDKILALSKLKGFADDNFSMTQMLRLWVEKHCGNGRKCW